jgi:hypothetical protein
MNLSFARMKQFGLIGLNWALDDGVHQATIPLSSLGGDLSASWRLYQIPLAQFSGVNLNSISAIVIKELSNSSGKNVFVDEIKFSGATLPGDVDGNGKVDIFDFNMVVTNFGKTGIGLSGGDLDGNGKVDIFDFNTIVTNFGH